MTENQPPPKHSAHVPFPATAWTDVRQAGGGDFDALERICRAYWPPAYGFFRHLGFPPAEAEDLVQTFFDRRVLRGHLLQGLSPAAGRFRAWFRESLRHHAAHAREHSAAQKRGGDVPHVSCDLPEFFEAEVHFQSFAAGALNPDTRFDQEFAVALITRVYQRLSDDYARTGKAKLFAALSPQLTGSSDRGEYERLAGELETSEGALRTAAKRLRDTFGLTLREEIVQTLHDPTDFPSELRHLIEAWMQAGAPTGKPQRPS